jgi:hypothetical protein
VSRRASENCRSRGLIHFIEENRETHANVEKTRCRCWNHLVSVGARGDARSQPSAGSQSGPFHGRVARRHRGERVSARIAGRRSSPRERRKRCRCSHCDERDDGRRRADDERHRRRPLCHRLRREGQQTLWIERQRLGSEGIDDRVSGEAGHQGDAATWDSFRHSSRRCRWLAETRRQIRPQEIERRLGGRDSNGARRLSGSGVGRTVLGWRSRLPAWRRSCHRDIPPQ